MSNYRDGHGDIVIESDLYPCQACLDKDDDLKILQELNKKIIFILESAPDIHEDETPINFMAKFEAWKKRAKQALARAEGRE